MNLRLNLRFGIEKFTVLKYNNEEKNRKMVLNPDNAAFTIRMDFSPTGG